MEFSKTIYDRITVAVIIISLFTMYMTWLTQDLSILSYLIPAWFGVFATATGFYYWKAKAENMIKLGFKDQIDNINDEFNNEFDSRF